MEKIKKYWSSLENNLSKRFIIVTAVASLILIIAVAIVGFCVPKSNNVIASHLEKLRTTDSQYVTSFESVSNLSDEIKRLNDNLTEKKSNLEEFTTSQNVLDKINDENDKLEQEQSDLQAEVNKKQSEVDRLEKQEKASSQATVTLSSGTYTVGENVKSGKFTVTGTGSITISSNGKAKVNTTLTSDGKEYTLNDGDIIKIQGKAQLIPN